MHKLFAFVALAVLHFGTAHAQVRITEFMYTGNGGEYIEITNIGNADVDLTGWSIDDDNRTPGIFLLTPLGLLAPGQSAVITETDTEVFRTQWGLAESDKVLGGMVSPAHNFSRNDEINIFNSANALVDRLAFGDETFPGTVRARNAGAWVTSSALGSNQISGWVLSSLNDIQSSRTSSLGDVGSPGTHSLAGSTLAQPPVFSHAAGLHPAEFELVLSPQNVGDTIYYTLDGSTPTDASNFLSGPITVGSRVGEPNDFSMIPSGSPDSIILPIGEVYKIVTVRAISVRPGALPSNVVTRSYIIGESNPYTLPVVSICTDRDDFWGYIRGIYVPGKIYDDNAHLPPSARPANYTQEGDAWQRRAHFEFFEPSGTLALSQPIGVRIHGGVSTSFRQKSLRIYAGEYGGPADFNYPFFGEAGPSVHRRLILRNAGNDNSGAFCRDDVLQGLVADSGVDTQASRPVIVFINGEYWGIHSIRERHDKYLIANTYGVDPENIDFLESYGLLPGSVREGDNIHYSNMVTYMRASDMTLDSTIAEVETRMDIDNFFTYWSAEIYSANYDWPQNNIRYWREKTPTARWQWMLYDTDLGFNWGSLSRPHSNSVHRLVTGTTWSTEIFRFLILNTPTKHRFLNRLADMLNREFVPARVAAHVEQYRTLFMPEMHEHSLRWSSPLTAATWNVSFDSMLTFAAERGDYVRQHTVASFGLDGVATVIIDNACPECGTVTINSISLTDDQLPWSGIYFMGVPVTVSVVAAPGYTCDGFYGVPDSSGCSATFNPVDSVVISPRFVPFCRADYNDDGGIDGSDIEAFFIDWESGQMGADVNNDGGLDGSDVEQFFYDWTNGGC